MHKYGALGGDAVRSWCALIYWDDIRLDFETPTDIWRRFEVYELQWGRDVQVNIKEKRNV
jgi:hypothetical protein